MKTIVFDSSVLISISEKCFLKILQKFAARNHVRLVIPQSVFEETVHRPETIHRFELNAVRLKQAVADGWIEVVPTDEKTKSLYRQISDLANHSFFVNEKPLSILQAGELEALALFKLLNADCLAIDERTCRMVLEDPFRLESWMAKRIDQKVSVDLDRLHELSELLGKPLVIRSCDLLGLCYRQRLFEGELSQSKQALEACLWSTKFAGCAVSGNEIEEFVRLS